MNWILQLASLSMLLKLCNLCFGYYKFKHFDSLEQDFETSIEFPWAPPLVELNKGAENKRVLHLDKIEENAKHWTTVDTCSEAVARASGSIEKDEISSIPSRHHSNVCTSKRWPPIRVP